MKTDKHLQGPKFNILFERDFLNETFSRKRFRAPDSYTLTPMNRMLSPYNLSRWGICTSFLVAMNLGGQPAPTTPAAASDPNDDEVVALSPFQVTSPNDRGYYSSNAAAGSVLPDTPIKNLPASLTVVNREMLEDLQPTNIFDALQFTSAFNIDTGQVRGVDTLGADGAGTGRGGFGTNGLTEAGAIERVEVFKGPPSLLYGSANPGGSVNAVSLRPKGQNAAALSFQYGSEVKQGRVQINRAITPKLWTVALLQYSERDNNNASGSGKVIVTDFDYDKRKLFYNSTIFRPWRDTEFIVDFEYLNSRENRGDQTSTRFVTINRPDGSQARLPWFLAYNVPLTWSVSGPDVRRRNDHYYITGIWNQKWADWLNTETTLWYQWRTAQNLLNTENLEESTTVPTASGLRHIRTSYARSVNDQRNLTFTQKALLNFEVGPTKNRVLLRYVRYYFNNDFQTFRAYTTGTDIVNGRVTTNEVRSRWFQVEGLSGEQIRAQNRSIPASVADGGDVLSRMLWRYDQDNHDAPERHQANAIYQGDIETPIGRFSPLAGMAYHKQIESYLTRYRTINGQIVNERLLQRPRRTGRAPTAGLTYAPIEDVSFWGLYAESFTVGNTQNSFNELLPNREGTNTELGVKIDLFNKRVAGTISYFRTKDFNRPLNDPNAFNVNTLSFTNEADFNSQNTSGDRVNPRDPRFNPNWLVANTPRGDNVAIGEYTAKGLDAEVVVEPVRNLQFILGVLLLDAGFTKDPNSSNIGRKLELFAEETYSIMGKYRFAEGTLKGLSIGTGYRWTSDRYLARVFQTSALGSPFRDIIIPGQDYLYGFVKYDFQAWGKRLFVQTNVDNALGADRFFSERTYTNPGTFPIVQPVVWRVTAGISF